MENYGICSTVHSTGMEIDSKIWSYKIKCRTNTTTHSKVKENESTGISIRTLTWLSYSLLAPFPAFSKKCLDKMQ